MPIASIIALLLEFAANEGPTLWNDIAHGEGGATKIAKVAGDIATVAGHVATATTQTPPAAA